MPTDLPQNQIRARVQAGETLFCIFTQIGSPLAVEAVGGVGFDFLLLDMEHGPLDLPDLGLHLQAAEAARVPAMVRVPWNDMVVIKRVLDLGAQSLMIPYVQSADEAEAAVRAVHYPPRGVRGTASSMRASGYGTIAEYHTRAGAEMHICCQIETTTAVDQIPRICAIPEVSSIFIGPSDLSASMGLIGQRGHPDLAAKIAEAKAAADAAGKPCGIMASGPEQAREYAAEGYRIVGLGSDMGLLVKSAKALLDKARA